MSTQAAGGRRAPYALVLAALAAWPLFGHLGTAPLWEDEADTVMLARNILRSGLPTAWDGLTFTDNDFGRRIAPRLFGADLVMVGTPWLPYYLAAASMAVFGESPAAARLPFAAAGLATVLLLFALVTRATGDLRAGFGAGLLLILSVQFLLYARECRSYPLTMLLTLAVLAGFLRLGQVRRNPWFAVAGIALFHVQVLPAAVTLGACGLLALVHPGFQSRLRPLLWRVPWIAALTLPWLAVSWSHTAINWDPLERFTAIGPRWLQFASEAGVAIPAVGWAVGLPWVWPRMSARERHFVALAGVVIVLHALAASSLLSMARLSAFGIRYACGLLPLAAGISGVLIARASGRRALVWAAGLALFGLTNLAGGALPDLLLGESRYLPGGFVAAVPRDLVDKLVNRTWFAFVGGLGRNEPGTPSRIADLLDREARPGQIVLSNYSAEIFALRTGLAQGFVLPEASPRAVRDAARAAGLPEYVFGPDRGDWLVWRDAADPIPGWSFARVEADLVARGASVELVARLPETHWENRPELHYHRFPGLSNPYWPRSLGDSPSFPDARVYRIRWPSAAP